MVEEDLDMEEAVVETNNRTVMVINNAGVLSANQEHTTQSTASENPNQPPRAPTLFHTKHRKKDLPNLIATTVERMATSHTTVLLKLKPRLDGICALDLHNSQPIPILQTLKMVGKEVLASDYPWMPL